MPKSEDSALYSLLLCGSTFLAIRRGFYRNSVIPLTRTRMFGGAIVFTAWQRYLASNGWTKTIASKFYVPNEPPEKEQLSGQRAHWNQGTVPGDSQLFTKTAMVTGVSAGGIGFYTAVGLYRMGAHVVITTREEDPERRLSLAKEIHMAASMPYHMEGIPSAQERITVVHLDFERQELTETVEGAVRQLDAQGIKSVDVLINNAGAFHQLSGPERAPRFHTINTGVELNTAVNAIGPMMLTDALKRRNKIARGGRVVYVSCDAHRSVKSMSDLDGLIHGRAVSLTPFDYYGASKFCTVALAAHENRQPANVKRGITTVACHPGTAVTGIFRDVPSMNFFRSWGLLPWVEGLALLVCKSPKEASYTPLYAASDPFLPQRLAERNGDEFYLVDERMATNKYASKLLQRNVEAQDETVRQMREIVAALQERKRKLDLRAAA